MEDASIPTPILPLLETKVSSTAVLPTTWTIHKVQSCNANISA